MDGVNVSGVNTPLQMASATAAAASPLPPPTQPMASGNVATLTPRTAPSAPIHVDVLIVGAGLSGIGFAWHLQKHCPTKSYAIVEARGALGGTWDLFRYPGIRSDSDMHTLGFSFRPWRGEKAIADGPSILSYLHETAAEAGIDKKIRYGHKVVRAAWSSDDALWTVDLATSDGRTQQWTCSYLQMCSGYYDYDGGYMPGWAGMERFKGQTVHPQAWPEDLDYSGKRVVVIGSGATAVTLVPAMVGEAAHVTMLQRSPSYVFSMPGFDGLSEFLGRFLPRKVVYNLARKRGIMLSRQMFKACRRWPQTMRRFILWRTRAQVGSGFDMAHFTPNYLPWDERLCLVPDGDLFKALASGAADVVTDHIETFTETGILLNSGREIDADIVITATGLNLQMLGGVRLSIDGQELPVAEQMTYKAALIEDIPNMAWVFGYTNASWTLKSEMVGEYLCRLLTYMDDNDYAVAIPRDTQGVVTADSIFDSMNAGYVKRAIDVLPRQGAAAPWQVSMSYEQDAKLLLEEPIEDGVLRFERALIGSARP